MQWTSRWRLLSLCGLGALLLAGCGGEMTVDADPSASTYSPTPPQSRDVGEDLTAPTVYTIDARSQDVWIYFDFSRGAVVPVLDPKQDGWDLAFQRYVIKTNSGTTNPTGQGGILNLGAQAFEAVKQVPADAAFVQDEHPKNRLRSYSPVLDKWFNYSYLANVLAPKRAVYILRTQDGKYVKLRLLSYYCKGGIAGCMTFEYVYQGDGSRNLAPPAA